MRPVGVVLAGGLGRRMGGDKAVVALRGRPLVHYPLAALGAVLDDLAVVAKRDTSLPALPPAVEIWLDHDERFHPLVGLTTALRCAAGRSVVVVACDMPHVTTGVLRALLDAPAAPAVVARADGRLQPLLARYAPEARPPLEAAGPDESATAVIERLAPVVVDVPAEAVFNVNAPEDLLRMVSEPAPPGSAPQ